LKKFFFLILSLLTIWTISAIAQRSDSEVLGVSIEADRNAAYSGAVRPRVAAETVSNIAAPSSLRALERKVFDTVNEERGRRGLQPLEWSDDASQLARSHSRNMAQYHFFSHRGLDGSMVNDRAERLGIFDWRAIGENIAFNRGYNDPAAFAVEKWLESSSHKANLLSREWNETGVGVALAPDGSYYFTQVFLLRK
jgi:uncharacterized protein YkwD